MQGSRVGTKWIVGRSGIALRLAAAGLLLGASGCLLADLDEEELAEEAVASVKQELATANGLRLANGLNLANGADLGNGIRLANGLNLANGLDLGNGIRLANGAVLDGIAGSHYAPAAGSDLEKWIDLDPAMRKRILRYIVECALPSSVTVRLKYRGVTETLATGIGNLGPGLQAGTMSTAEQERVTACLLARVNAKGHTVTVNLFGPFTGFRTASSAEISQYSREEAAFYGNVFLASGSDAFVCRLNDLDTCSFRACAQPDGSCNCGVIEQQSGGGLLGLGLTIQGCKSGGLLGLPVSQGACSSSANIGSTSAKYVYNCSGSGRNWANVMTVRVQPKPAGTACYAGYECQSNNCQSGACR